MINNNSGETTLEPLYDRLRQKSVSDLLKEREEIWDREDTDLDLINVYETVLEEKGYQLPSYDSGKGLEDFKATYPSLFRSQNEELKPEPPKPSTSAPHTRKSLSPVQLLSRLCAAILIMAALLVVAQGTGTLRWVTLQMDGAYALMRTSGPVELPQGADTDFLTFQEALDAYGVVDKVAPTWIPTEFALSSVKAVPMGETVLIIAKYDTEDGRLINMFFTLGKSSFVVNETNDSKTVEPYVFNGITFYISVNVDQFQADWKTDTYECTLSGDINEKELKAMIHSIFEE